MRLKKIKKIRVAFLIIILAMILLETIMDTICVYKQQAHLTLYSFDLFLYLLIIYVEALQIDYIVQLLKKQKQPHIRGNLKIYEVLVSLSILFLLNHITFQCYYMYENGTVKECYYFSQEGESKFLIFLSTLIIELLILIDLLIVWIQVFRIIKKERKRSSSIFLFHKYLEDYLIKKESESRLSNNSSQIEQIDNF